MTPDEFKKILLLQIQSWESGKALSVESLLERFSSLADDPVHLLALILSERQLSVERGQSIEGQLLGRFPEHSDELKNIFSSEKPVLRGFDIVGSEPAGRGGTAVVWKARDGLGQDVAIKAIYRWACGDDKYFDCLSREGNKLASFKYRHIAKVREVDESVKDRVLIVMEWYDNGSLGNWIGRPDFPGSQDQPAKASRAGSRGRLRWIAANLSGVANAIDHVHQSYFHRDIKPQNILVDRFGRWHLADFGFARPIEDGDTELRSLAGTPPYLDPMLLVAKKGEFPNYRAADIYGLGAVLYVMLTGRVPFETAGTTSAILDAIEKGDDPLPSGRFDARLSEEFDAICNGNGPHPRGRLDDRAPKELERICRRAMAVEPKHRYASGAHLARDLEKWLAAERRRPVLVNAAACALLLVFLAFAISERIHSRRLHESERIQNRRRLDEVAGQFNGAKEAAENAFKEFNLGKLNQAYGSLREARNRLDPPHDPSWLSKLASETVTSVEDCVKRANSSDGAAKRAKDMLNRGSFQEAEREARVALDKCHSNPMGHFVLGVVYGYRREFDKSAYELDVALKHRPHLPEAIEYRAITLAGARKFDSAKEFLSRFTGADNYEPAANVALARIYYLTNEPDRAIELLRTVIKADPEDVVARRNLALFILSEGQGHEAVANLQEVVARNGADPAACFALGAILLECGDCEQAIQWLQRSGLEPAILTDFCLSVFTRKELRARLAEGDVPVDFGQRAEKLGMKYVLATAEAYYYEGEYAAAASLYQKAFSDRFDEKEGILSAEIKNQPWLRYQLINSIWAAALASAGARLNRIPCDGFSRSRARNQAQDRIYFIINMCKSGTPAERPFPEVLQGIAFFGHLLHGREFAAMRAGSSDPEDLKNWQKLREEAQKALVSFKDNARLNPSLLDASAAKPLACQLADAVRIRGDAWSECREYDKAIADYGEAIRLNPNDFGAYNNRGNARLRKGEYDKAIGDYTHAMSIAPEDASAYRNRGLAWLSKKEYGKAIGDCTNAVQIKPDFALAYRDRGLARFYKNEYDVAIEDFTKALNLSPGNASVANNLAWLRATCPDAKYRDGKTAVDLATLACKLTDWKDPKNIGTLAAANAEAGDFEAAVKWQLKANEMYGGPAEKAAGAKRIKLYQERKRYRKSDP